MGDPVEIDAWQLAYFAEAIARGMPHAEAAGCAGITGLDDTQLEALARRDDMRLRILLALRNRLGIANDAEAERAMLRAECWARYLSCVARTKDADARGWLRMFAELGGMLEQAQRPKDEAARMTDAELREEITKRQSRLRLVSGSTTPG